MIHPRVQLVTAEVVATMRGLQREHIYELVDGADVSGRGAFLWVFNVGTGRERELRFWRRELMEPVATKDFELEEVIGQILPARELGGFQKWEVGELLRVSRQRLMELELNFTPRTGGMFIPRLELQNFFRRRWLFAGISKTKTEIAK